MEHSSPSTKPASEQFEVRPDYRDLLFANDLKSVDAMMDFPGGTVVRSVPGRTTRRIQIPASDGSLSAAYLKCYEPGYLPLKRRVANLLGFTGNRDEAFNEWYQILALRERGFRTATPIAAGWRRHGSRGDARSFVMTAEIADAVSGYDYWKLLDGRQRRVFIHRLAALARRFHEAGFIHKDFYLGHIFVDPSAAASDLYLIDLQRVLGPGTFRRRWLDKDIGGMIFSLQRAGASRTQVLQLYQLYRNIRRLTTADKRRFARLLRRAAAIHRHTPKHGESPEAEL